MDWSLLALPGLLVWVIIIFLPWRPWSTRESLDAEQAVELHDLSQLTILIPARNEEAVIGKTLRGLAGQDPSLKILLIDDQSSDRTSAIALEQGLSNLRVIPGEALPEGWSGKLWALEQGRQRVDTELILLLDADIYLQPGTLHTLLAKFESEGLDMLSLMASLRMQGAWEKLLMPAFIFFFKLLYPFRLSNSPSQHIAAAAGGVILVKRQLLEQLGAFACLRGNLIDDCALARKIKNCGGKTWIGLTHSAISLRSYDRLDVIWEMVARTAFTQLRHSWTLLLLCTVLMLAAFVSPVLDLCIGSHITGLLALMIMMSCYLPTLRYYAIHPAWALTLPLSGTLYLLITWSSAYHHLFRSGARWKNRHYSAPASK